MTFDLRIHSFYPVRRNVPSGQEEWRMEVWVGPPTPLGSARNSALDQGSEKICQVNEKWFWFLFFWEKLLQRECVCVCVCVHTQAHTSTPHKLWKCWTQILVEDFMEQLETHCNYAVNLDFPFVTLSAVFTWEPESYSIYSLRKYLLESWWVPKHYGRCSQCEGKRDSAKDYPEWAPSLYPVGTTVPLWARNHLIFYVVDIILSWSSISPNAK